MKSDEHWLNLTEAMGRPDLRDDEKLRKLAGRIERIDELTEEIAAWAAQHTRNHVNELCQKHHIPSAPLRYVNEVLEDPHLRARGFLTDHITESGNTVALPNSPIRFEGSALKPLQPPPKLGQHTDEVLTELCGVGPAELANLRRDGVI